MGPLEEQEALLTTESSHLKTNPTFLVRKNVHENLHNSTKKGDEGHQTGS